MLALQTPHRQNFQTVVQISVPMSMSSTCATVKASQLQSLEIFAFILELETSQALPAEFRTILRRWVRLAGPQRAFQVRYPAFKSWLDLDRFALLASAACYLLCYLSRRPWSTTCT